MRPTHVYVRPRETRPEDMLPEHTHLLIRDEYEVATVIPAEGRRVKFTRHIERRLIAGDLIEIPEPTSAETDGE